jgi:hypothetical protein
MWRNSRSHPGQVASLARRLRGVGQGSPMFGTYWNVATKPLLYALTAVVSHTLAANAGPVVCGLPKIPPPVPPFPVSMFKSGTCGVAAAEGTGCHTALSACTRRSQSSTSGMPPALGNPTTVQHARQTPCFCLQHHSGPHTNGYPQPRCACITCRTSCSPC